MVQLEQRYIGRIKEIQDTTSTQINELQLKVKSLERENRQLNDKIEMSHKSKLSEQGSLEKRFEKVQDERDRLKEELDQIKQDRDSKVLEHQRVLDKEREMYKQKLRDVEGKGTSAQAKQTEMMLNFEKERAKWEHEKSYLLNQKDDAIENVSRLEKKIETLTRDNEKLKQEKNQVRRTAYQAG